MILSTTLGKCSVRLSTSGKLIFSSMFTGKGDIEEKEHFAQFDGGPKFRFTAGIALKSSKVPFNIGFLLGEDMNPLPEEKKVATQIQLMLGMIKSQLTSQHMDILHVEHQAHLIRSKAMKMQEQADKMISDVHAKYKGIK